MKATKKVGIMGGTFNPIHNGHLAMAQNAYEQFQLDQVIFMPSGNSYLKSNVLEASKRMEMVKIAIQSISYFTLSTLEIERKGNTYTYETLQELKRGNPDTHYFFILGADSLMYLENWKNPEIISSLATILCAVRDDYDMDVIYKKRDLLHQKLHADIQFIEMEKIELSSTMIRERRKKHESISGLVPEPVFEYMKREHLYEED